MKERELMELLERAIRNRLKIHLQMGNTDEGQFILFHPHAELIDAFTGASYPGLIEKHYSHEATNFFAWPRLSGIKTVLLTNETFQPDHKIWEHVSLENVEVRLKA